MNIGVIFAGGVGKRMKNNGAPKQFLNLYGDPVIVHTLRKFQNNPLIDQIIIVMLEQYIPFTQKLVDKNGFRSQKSYPAATLAKNLSTTASTPHKSS